MGWAISAGRLALGCGISRASALSQELGFELTRVLHHLAIKGVADLVVHALSANYDLIALPQCRKVCLEAHLVDGRAPLSTFPSIKASTIFGSGAAGETKAYLEKRGQR